MATPAVPTLTLCDRLVEELAPSFGRTADVVERVYDAPYTYEDMPKVGRLCYVFPVGYTIGAETREQDRFSHRVAVVMIARFPFDAVAPYQEGSPPESPLRTWADELVGLFYTAVVRGLDFAKSGALQFAGRTVWTREIGEVEVYDPDALTSHNVFRSSVEFTFDEIL